MKQNEIQILLLLVMTILKYQWKPCKIFKRYPLVSKYAINRIVTELFKHVNFFIKVPKLVQANEKKNYLYGMLILPHVMFQLPHLYKIKSFLT